jgi:hypothetical protein
MDRFILVCCQHGKFCGSQYSGHAPLSLESQTGDFEETDFLMCDEWR